MKNYTLRRFPQGIRPLRTRFTYVFVACSTLVLFAISSFSSVAVARTCEADFHTKSLNRQTTFIMNFAKCFNVAQNLFKCKLLTTAELELPRLRGLRLSGVGRWTPSSTGIISDKVHSVKLLAESRLPGMLTLFRLLFTTPAERDNLTVAGNVSAAVMFRLIHNFVNYLGSPIITLRSGNVRHPTALAVGFGVYDPFRPGPLRI